MTSCKILSCASDSSVKPMRLAGTCRRYSKRAMPRLTSPATYHARPLRFFKCAYHANVMKTFEPMRSSVVHAIAGIKELYHGAAFELYGAAGSPMQLGAALLPLR